MASQYDHHDVGSSGFGILSSELGVRDLPSKRLLGTGLASVGYETELNGKKYARKDFMGVPSSTFRREAGRLIGLGDHINVVKTLDWTKNNMSCSLVLEYMDDDLLGFLQKRKQSQGSMEAGPNFGNEPDLDNRNTIKLAPLELPEALDLMLQIARGMEYLADKGIRHGNLKTKNVLVTHTDGPDGKSLSVKVSDFGLVRTRRKSTSFASRQARKLDMARWTAPELLQVFLLEDKGETSSESDSDEDCADFSDDPQWSELSGDVYSFAVTCSQILTGEDPFPYPNLNWKELGVNILRHGLTPKLPASCPPELEELLVSCWDFDHLYLGLHGRPSFSYICSFLQRLQQMDFSNISTRSLHESLLLHEKAPMDMTRKDQLRQPMPGEEPTDVVRQIGLREPINVEDLWGTEWLQHEAWRSRGPLARENTLSMSLQKLTFDVASLITRTRTVVRRRTEWTQLREELELFVPDMLRIRNQWVNYERTLDVESVIDLWRKSPLDVWWMRLNRAVRDTSREVGEQQQENDRSLLSSWSAALTEPWRLSKLRNDFSELAKERKKIMLDLTKSLRQAHSRRARAQANEQGKARAKAETISTVVGWDSNPLLEIGPPSRPYKEAEKPPRRLYKKDKILAVEFDKQGRIAKRRAEFVRRAELVKQGRIVEVEKEVRKPKIDGR